MVVCQGCLTIGEVLIVDDYLTKKNFIASLEKALRLLDYERQPQVVLTVLWGGLSDTNVLLTSTWLEMARGVIDNALQQHHLEQPLRRRLRRI